MTLFVRDSQQKRRDEIMDRLKGMQEQYEELKNHRDDVNRGIEVMEMEFYRIEGELRLLEQIGNEEREIKAGIKKNG